MHTILTAIFLCEPGLANATSIFFYPAALKGNLSIIDAMLLQAGCPFCDSVIHVTHLETFVFNLFTQVSASFFYK